MKISKGIQVIITLVTALVLSACAGTHPKPPSDYYTKINDTDTLRVAFDQNWHIYPISSEAWNWNSDEFQNHWRCKITGCSYQLMKLQRDGERVYDPIVDRNDNVAHVINDLNKLLLEKDKLAIFIHGFNNDYGDAQAIYKEFRSRMDNTAILEVYWDGVENKVPLKIWFPALTYSNLAGQIGLRPIINGINKPIDLIVATHSRGAAVAISTFSDPIYDPGICAPQEENNPICDPKACECETQEVCLCTSQKENLNNFWLHVFLLNPAIRVVTRELGLHT